MTSRTRNLLLLVLLSCALARTGSAKDREGIIHKSRAAVERLATTYPSRRPLDPARYLEIERSAAPLIPATERYGKPVFRGFSLQSFGPREMARYLFGDFRHILGSRELTRTLEQKLRTTRDFDRAMDETMAAMQQTIHADIRKEGALGYAIAQSRATMIALGEEHKKSTGLAASMNSLLERPDLELARAHPTMYGGFPGILVGSARQYARPAPDGSPAFIVQVNPTPGIGVKAANEYYFLSHVPPTRIRRFFVGYGQGSPMIEAAGDGVRWFDFKISARDRKGVPTKVIVREAKLIHRVSVQGERIASNAFLYPQFKLGKTLWRSDQSGPRAAALDELPELGRAVDEIAALLRK